MRLGGGVWEKKEKNSTLKRKNPHYTGPMRSIGPIAQSASFNAPNGSKQPPLAPYSHIRPIGTQSLPPFRADLGSVLAPLQPFSACSGSLPHISPLSPTNAVYGYGMLSGSPMPLALTHPPGADGFDMNEYRSWHGSKLDR